MSEARAAFERKCNGTIKKCPEPERRLCGINGTTKKYNEKVPTKIQQKMEPNRMPGARAAFERKCYGTIKTCLEPERRLSGNAMENMMECLEPERRLSRNALVPYLSTIIWTGCSPSGV